jgi:hypothetical protein
MVMCRSLDWPGAEVLARATRAHEFQDSAGRTAFVSAGLTGMVGVLTGVRPGAYSIALNFAHAKRSIRPAADPTMMIRRLLEDAGVASFGAAKLAISKWNLGAPCFISLCGIARGEGCVFEFLPGGAPPGPRDGRRLRRAGEPLRWQGGHRGDDAAGAGRRGDALPGDARAVERHAAAAGGDALRGMGANAKGEPIEAAALRIWSEVPVRNYETTQFVVMRAEQGGGENLGGGPRVMSERETAPSAERNKQPILEVLARVLPATGHVLEIGSGTGQHVTAFRQGAAESRLPAERDGREPPRLDRRLGSAREARERSPTDRVRCLAPAVAGARGRRDRLHQRDPHLAVGGDALR